MKYKALVSSVFFAIATGGLSAVAMADSHDSGENASGEGGTSGAMGDNSELFMQLDANADGFISEDEAAALPDVEDQFDELDQDGDGMLSEEEFKEYEQQETGQ